MILDGFIVFLGVVFVLVKLPRSMLLKALGHPLALDLAVSAITLVIHWGTFSGVMTASIAGLLCSIGTSVMRQLVGYIEDGKYTPGTFRLQI